MSKCECTPPTAKKARLAAKGWKEAADDEVDALSNKHETEFKAIVTAIQRRQAEEMRDLKARIEAERAQLLKAAEEDPSDCKECSAPLNADVAHFVCCLCAFSVCSKHKGNMTQCEECSKTYCDECVSSIPTCAGCAAAPQLACCNLEQMPCGEWEHGDCSFYHHKHCGCQKARNEAAWY